MRAWHPIELVPSLAVLSAKGVVLGEVRRGRQLLLLRRYKDKRFTIEMIHALRMMEDYENGHVYGLLSGILL
jgi:hypothetical protein